MKFKTNTGVTGTKILFLIFLLLGLGLLAGSTYWYFNTKSFLSTASVAKGVVTELSRVRSDGSDTYKPHVRFKTKNNKQIEFISNSSSNPPAYDVGEKVDVFYDLNEPKNAKIDGFFSLWGGPFILFVIGFIFSIVGGASFIYRFLKTRKITRLKTTGTQITAKFTDVAYNSHIKINGRSPYQIVAQWQNPKTSKIHVFKSDYIYFNPEKYIKDENISLLIDRKNPKIYAMNIGFLPDLAD